MSLKGRDDGSETLTTVSNDDKDEYDDLDEEKGKKDEGAG